MELLQSYVDTRVPDVKQLEQIYSYCKRLNKKACYLFTKNESEINFTANFGEVYFANGNFFDFDTQTFSTQFSK